MDKNFDLEYGVGLDLSENMVKYAQDHNQSQKLNFVKGDMSDCQFNKSFDLITCNYDAINHLTFFRIGKRCLIRFTIT